MINQNGKRFDCLKMKEDIQRRMNEKYPTTDALYKHLLEVRETNLAFVEECKKHYREKYCI
jgi:hypothetical protein